MKQHNDFKILIAEDDAAIRKMYEKTFRQEGYEVVTVEAGGQILAELADSSFDLLITDLKLNHTSALEILPEVRKIHSRLPVIVVSGYYSNMVEDFHQKGFNVNLFLNKPLGLSDLKTAVRRVLGLPVEETTDKTSF
jgi:two-component system, NtrC family, nitrogen regulation response regulator GlnG